MAQANPMVGLHVLAVPDGLHASADGRRWLRLSLSVTPDPSAPQQDIDLRAWPRAVAQACANLRVLVGKPTGGFDDQERDHRSVGQIRVAGVAVPDIAPDLLLTEAAGLWQRIFTTSGGYDATIATLRKTLVDGGANAPKTLGDAGVVLGGFDTAEISRMLDAVSASVVAATLVGRLVRHAAGPEGLRAGTHFASNRLDVGGPGLGWWQAQHQAWLGTEPAQDPVTRLARRHDLDRGLSLAAKAPARVAAAQTKLNQRLRSDTPLALAELPRVGLQCDLGGARRFFSDQILQPRYWAHGEARESLFAGVIGELSAFAMLADEVVRVRRAVEPPTGPPPEDDKITPEEVVARKFTGILGHPTLAKYLRLVVDLNIPEAWVAGSGRVVGALAVDLDAGNTTPPDAKERLWTTFVYDPQTQYFGPAPRREAGGDPNAPALFVDGLLNLRVTYAGARRFELHPDDCVAVLTDYIRKAEMANEAVRKGALVTDPEFAPERKSRGMTLLDRFRRLEAEAEERRQKDIARVRQEGGTQIRDAEDLLQGYRIDMAVNRKGDTAAADSRRWRPLNARDVGFGRDIGAAFMAATAAVRGRDDGLVRPMTASKALEEDGKLVTHLEPHDQLFTWQGDSLGVPGLLEPVPGCEPDPTEWGRYAWPNPEEDLAVDVSFDVPAGKPAAGEDDRRCAPLRQDFGYWAGARLVFTNGCGLTIGRAARRYAGVAGRADQPNVTLGDGAEGPYAYLRRLPVRAPEVLLAWNDPLVTSANDKLPPGETIDDIVVRSTDASGRPARRFAAPPRASFDVLEQAGVLDDSRHDGRLETGALATREIHLVLDDRSGEFPLARDGSYGFPPRPLDPCQPTPSSDLPRSRGAVLAFEDVRNSAPATPFLPDPMARRLRGALTDEFGSTTGFGPPKAPLDFWGDKQHPLEARPIVVELVRGRSERMGTVRARFNERARKETFRLPRHPSVDLRKLSVELAPGETAVLNLWADTGRETTGKHKVTALALEQLAAMPLPGAAACRALGLGPDGARRFRASLEALAAGAPDAGTLLDELLIWPLDQVHHRRKVRLVHAVDRPLLSPRFRDEKVKGQGRLSFHPVVLTVQPDPPAGTPVDPDRQTWASYVARQLKAGVHPLDFPSEEGGSTTFFVGQVWAERLTTGKLRAEARWVEEGPESFKVADDGSVTYTPPSTIARLFGFETDPLDRADPEKPQSLMYDEAATPGLRGLSHTFANGRARRLKLRLVGTSRFTSYFAPDTTVPGERKDGLGLYEKGTPTLETSATEVVTPCTFRPPPPNVDRIVPAFRWTRTVVGRRELKFKREASIRVYLKPDWFASGADEAVGLLFWPPGFSGGDVCGLDGIAPFDRFMTRWGDDPIHKPAVTVTGLLDRDQLPSVDIQPGRLLQLYLASSPDPGAPTPTKPRDVEVLGYKVHTDDPQGPYCDIRIEPKKTYFPFVQMGLSRLQMNAVAGLELSHPSVAMAQLPPQWEGTVKFVGNSNFKVSLVVTSSGYKDPDGRRPLLNVRLLEAAASDGVPASGPFGHRMGWRPVLHDGKPVEFLGLTPDGLKLDATWTVDEIRLPRGRFGERPYALLIEGTEVLPADAGPCEPAVLKERSPLFSHIVELGIWRQD